MLSQNRWEAEFNAGEFVGAGPTQEVVHPIYRVVGAMGPHVEQQGLWIDTVKLGSSDQPAHGASAFVATVCIRK